MCRIDARGILSFYLLFITGFIKTTDAEMRTSELSGLTPEKAKGKAGHGRPERVVVTSRGNGFLLEPRIETHFSHPTEKMYVCLHPPGSAQQTS